MPWVDDSVRKDFSYPPAALPTSVAEMKYSNNQVTQLLNSKSYGKVSVLQKAPLHQSLTSPQPQNEYIENWQQQHGKRLDHEERVRKRTARESHKVSKDSQNLTGLRAKLHQKKRHHEKIQMKKAIRAHEEKNVKSTGPSEPSSQPLPQYLLDRSGQNDAKALSSAIKNKRNEKAAKFSVPLPKVKGISEEEIFKVVKTGKKTQQKGWKRMITKPTVCIYMNLLSGSILLTKIFPAVRWSRLHPPTCKVRALYQTDGTTL